MDLFDNTAKEIYDSFNNFILADETKVFGKLIARSIFTQQTINIPGDIVECGVFMGSGMVTFLKLKKNMVPKFHKKSNWF